MSPIVLLTCGNVLLLWDRTPFTFSEKNSFYLIKTEYICATLFPLKGLRVADYMRFWLGMWKEFLKKCKVKKNDGVHEMKYE